MKRLLTLMVLALFLAAAGANACDGMLALFSDQSGGSCDAEIGYCEPVPLYLMYIRGTGPEIAAGVAFRLAKSTAGAMFLEPQWSGQNLTYGSLESGIDVVFNLESGGWCSGSASVAYVGTIPVVNFSDPDTFTVAVVDQPSYPGVFVLKCLPARPMYRITGGVFVFNGQCRSPEDPFGEHVAVAASSWGAIKSMYQ
jgi:uncharacterized protein (DUF779 family)